MTGYPCVLTISKGLARNRGFLEYLWQGGREAKTEGPDHTFHCVLRKAFAQNSASVYL